MAIFTIAATIVLVFTLRSANKTNLAALKASSAALEANKIMNQQSAGYLIVEGADVQAQTFGILIRITVRNIGFKPVRRATAIGQIRFMWSSDDGGAVPSFKSEQAKIEAYIGVVEPAQTASGVTYVPWNNLTDDAATYEFGIIGNKTPDLHCDVFWDDTNPAKGWERHILSAGSDGGIFNSDKGDVISLGVTYSGMHRDWEDKNSEDHEG